MNKKDIRIINDKLMLFRVSQRNSFLMAFDSNIREHFLKLLAYFLKDFDFSANSSFS